MQKKILLIVGIVIAVGAGLLGVRSFSKGSAPREVTIGAVLPLTGNLAFLGESYRDAITMALEELPKRGVTYKVIFEDDGFDPKKAASAANKLISIDNADVILSFGSPSGNAISPIAEAQHVVHINGIASDPAVAQGTYNFVHWTPPFKEAELMKRELLERGFKKVVLLETNQPGTIAVGDALEKILTDTPSLAARMRFNPGEKDFRTIISRVKEVQGDILLLIATSPELEILAKQVRQAGITIPLSSIESFEFTSTPALFEGLWYVNVADPTPEFVAQFTKRFGKAPAIGAANGYDVINLIDGAKHIEDKKSLVDALYSISRFKGAVGEVSINADGFIVSEPTVRMIKNGVAETIKK